jgi:hypothetical protein
MSEAEIGDCDEAMKLLSVSGAGPNSPLNAEFKTGNRSPRT